MQHLITAIITYKSHAQQEIALVHLVFYLFG